MRILFVLVILALNAAHISGMEIEELRLPTLERSALEHAIESNDMKILRILNRHSATDDDGNTVLHIVVEKGTRECVLYILSDRADSSLVTDVLAENKDNRTPLHIASIRGCKEIMEDLIGHGADRDCTDKNGHTTLHLAARNGCIDVFQLLISQVSLVDKEGNTPLHLAAENGHAAAVSKLIEVGAPLWSRNHNGLTPLHLACLRGYKSVIKVYMLHVRNAHEINELIEAGKIIGLYDISWVDPIESSYSERNSNLDQQADRCLKSLITEIQLKKMNQDALIKQKLQLLEKRKVTADLSAFNQIQRDAALREGDRQFLQQKAHSERRHLEKLQIDAEIKNREASLNELKGNITLKEEQYQADTIQLSRDFLSDPEKEQTRLRMVRREEERKTDPVLIAKETSKITQLSLARLEL